MDSDRCLSGLFTVSMVSMKGCMQKQQTRIYALLLFSAMSLLTACAGSANMAPVVNAWQRSDAVIGQHVVQKGDTLYSIAWRYGVDYRYLAQLNQLPESYALRSGQHLKIAGKLPPRSKPTPAKHPTTTLASNSQPVKTAALPKRASPSPQKSTASTSQAKVKRWAWPVRGKILQTYSEQSNGIDIAGKIGQAVKTTAAGVVVYAGNGLANYGNLIIIKHNDEYLSAYAHNNQLLVQEGSRVQAGQVIAHMGNTGTDRVKLHFEIRKAGNPVNPLSLLTNT
jgi:lipoprotein NlpD